MKAEGWRMEDEKVARNRGSCSRVVLGALNSARSRVYISGVLERAIKKRRAQDATQKLGLLRR